MTGLMLLGPFVCEVGVGTIATVPDRFGNLWLNQLGKNVGWGWLGCRFLRLYKFAEEAQP